MHVRSQHNQLVLLLTLIGMILIDYRVAVVAISIGIVAVFIISAVSFIIKKELSLSESGWAGVIIGVLVFIYGLIWQ